MDKIEFEKENNYLKSTIELVNEKLKMVESYSKNVDAMLDESNAEYFEYLPEEYINVLKVLIHEDFIQEVNFDLLVNIICKLCVYGIKGIDKKIWEKFGGFRKKLYLCTRNSEMICLRNGSVAQLNRALDYGSRGCGFESHRNHKEAVFGQPFPFL